MVPIAVPGHAGSRRRCTKSSGGPSEAAIGFRTGGALLRFSRGPRPGRAASAPSARAGGRTSRPRPSSGRGAWDIAARDRGPQRTGGSGIPPSAAEVRSPRARNPSRDCYPSTRAGGAHAPPPPPSGSCRPGLTSLTPELSRVGVVAGDLTVGPSL